MLYERGPCASCMHHSLLDCKIIITLLSEEIFQHCFYFSLPHRREMCVFFVCVVFGPCPPQPSVCPVISIFGCLLFFSCNQTGRFISVALKDRRNQFPSAVPCGRARSGATPVHAFHSPTHSLNHPYMTHTYTQVKTEWPVIHHITVF